MKFSIIKEYGVVHLSQALTPQEQKALLESVGSHARGVSAVGIFHASSGAKNSPHRVENLHTLGEMLFTRCAEAVVENLTPEEVAQEPSLQRLADAASGVSPPNVSEVTGAAYKKGATMKNHSDLDRPLYSMSVAVGDACDFIVGKKTLRPKKNERSGRPVTIRMESGDAIYFDGGGVPHEVGRIVEGTAPPFFKKFGATKGLARISVIFREPC